MDTDPRLFLWGIIGGQWNPELPMAHSLRRKINMTRDRETWLQSIRSNPSDWQAMLVFADWLEEEGDLLAAEQWRWIACVGDDTRDGFAHRWPSIGFRWSLLDHEVIIANLRQIRLIKHYPLTIEDVQAHLKETAVRST